MRFLLLVVVILCVTVNAQFAVQNWLETTGPRSNFTLCSTYCNVSNAECIYPRNYVTFLDGIVLARWSPGICQCYDGWGGPTCSDDIFAIQNTTGRHISLGCKYQLTQSIPLANGSFEFFTQCPCALGYIGKNCDNLCQMDCNQDKVQGFCHAQLNHRPACFCYQDWTGWSCNIRMPTWVRSVKDAIGYVTLPIIFIFLLGVALMVPILILIPKKGKTFKDHHKQSMTLKLLSAGFVIASLLIKLLGSVIEWSWNYLNPATLYMILLDIVLNMCAFMAMITLWSQLKDVATRNEKGVKTKMGLGITAIIVQLILFGIFTIVYGAFSVFTQSTTSTNTAYQWLYFVYNILAFFEFFAFGLGFLFFGLRAFIDLRKVDPEIKFESLKFTQFMTAICIVFASQGLWQLILSIDLACTCLGGTGFFVFTIVQIHEFIYLTLMIFLLLPDAAQLKHIFCPCIKNKDEDS